MVRKKHNISSSLIVSNADRFFMQGTKMLTVDELIATLDGDGDKKVSKAEWVENLGKCVGNPRSFGTPELKHMLSYCHSN
jgi:hypothetical protein